MRLAAPSNTLKGNTIHANTTDGVILEGNSNTTGGTTTDARNLIYDNGDDGVEIANGSNNQVLGNYIGTANGTSAAANGENGVRVLSSNNTIGGTTAGARNIISGNSYGVLIEAGATGNQVLGNYIGTNASGTAALSNLYGGMGISGSNNTVGGTTAGARNIISGNGGIGVYIDGNGNQVLGNYIGTNAAGTAALRRPVC